MLTFNAELIKEVQLLNSSTQCVKTKFEEVKTKKLEMSWNWIPSHILVKLIQFDLIRKQLKWW